MCLHVLLVQYTIPDAESSILLPGVIGFLVTISSQQSNRKTDEYFLRDSFSSTILQQVDLQGNVEALVEVVTEVGNFSNTSMETVSCEFILQACMKLIRCP